MQVYFYDYAIQIQVYYHYVMGNGNSRHVQTSFLFPLLLYAFGERVPYYYAYLTSSKGEP